MNPHLRSSLILPPLLSLQCLGADVPCRALPCPPPTPLVRAIHTLPSFSVLTAEQLTATLTEMDALKRKIFGQICLQLGTTRYESSMEFLVKLAKGPIGELKHAAYDVLRALAYQTGTWGVHTLFEFTGFFPFLLVGRATCTYRHVVATGYYLCRYVKAWHATCFVDNVMYAHY
jgi:hypothetical protein